MLIYIGDSIDIARDDLPDHQQSISGDSQNRRFATHLLSHISMALTHPPRKKKPTTSRSTTFTYANTDSESKQQPPSPNANFGSWIVAGDSKGPTVETCQMAFSHQIRRLRGCISSTPQSSTPTESSPLQQRSRARSFPKDSQITDIAKRTKRHQCRKRSIRPRKHGTRLKRESRP